MPFIQPPQPLLELHGRFITQFTGDFLDAGVRMVLMPGAFEGVVSQNVLAACSSH